MPITNGLENSRKLRETGFTQQQAEVLAEIIEHAQQQGFDRFSEILERGLTQVSNGIALLGSRVESRLEALESRFEALESRVDSKIEGLRAELHSSLRDQLLKFVTILVAVVSLAVAVIKLFPDP